MGLNGGWGWWAVHGCGACCWCMGGDDVVGGGYKCSVILPRLVMLEMGWGWEGPRLGH